MPFDRIKFIWITTCCEDLIGIEAEVVTVSHLLLLRFWCSCVFSLLVQLDGRPPSVENLLLWVMGGLSDDASKVQGFGLGFWVGEQTTPGRLAQSSARNGNFLIVWHWVFFRVLLGLCIISFGHISNWKIFWNLNKLLLILHFLRVWVLELVGVVLILLSWIKSGSYGVYSK